MILSLITFHIISPQFENDIIEVSSIISTTHDFLTVDLIHNSSENFELNSDDLCCCTY